MEIEEAPLHLEDFEIDDEISSIDELETLSEIEFDDEETTPLQAVEENNSDMKVEVQGTLEPVNEVEDNCADPLEFILAEDIKWAADFDLLGSNIKSLPHGIDLPSAIFSIAVNSFNLTSGIFLTFERKSEFFSPFASLSIDETSLRRCQLPIKTLEENNLIFSGSSIYTRIQKDFLKPYLSRRQWDTIETLDMCIFNHHDKTFGLLLMFNCTAGEDPQFNDFASFFTRKCSELFSNSRSSKISSLPSLPLSPPVNSDEAFKIISQEFPLKTSNTTDPVKVIIINYADIIENILLRNSSIDKFRLENDIFKMYNSMLFGSSFIVRITESRLLIVFTSGLSSNNMIIQNQMSASLLSLFQENSIIKQPVITVEEFQSEDADILVKIQEFLSINL